MNQLSSFKNILPIYYKNRSPFLSLQQELNRLMNDFNGGYEPFSFPLEEFENLAITPSVDVVDDNEHFKVEVEMPGMGMEDINVNVSDGYLTIKGEKTTSKKDDKKNYQSREIRYGKYERIIALPDSVDIGQAKASFKKGMLWVEFPKKEEAKNNNRDIKIERG